jgi:hypothetical protein
MAFHKTFDRIAPILMADFIKTFDLTPEQAAGFVGNFGAESSLISGQQEGKPLGTTETIRGHTGGIDWPQWTASRRTAFAKFVESKKLPYPSDPQDDNPQGCCRDGRRALREGWRQELDGASRPCGSGSGSVSRLFAASASASASGSCRAANGCDTSAGSSGAFTNCCGFGCAGC